MGISLSTLVRFAVNNHADLDKAGFGVKLTKKMTEDGSTATVKLLTTPDSLDASDLAEAAAYGVELGGTKGPAYARKIVLTGAAARSVMTAAVGRDDYDLRADERAALAEAAERAEAERIEAERIAADTRPVDADSQPVPAGKNGRKGK